MGKHKEHVEHLKGHAGNGEEVDRNHAAEVIAKEGLPVVGRAGTTARDHVSGDGSLSNGDTELEQLAVDPRSTPQRIGLVHLPDQDNDVRANGSPAGFARTTLPPPKEAKTRSMPLDDGVRLKDPKRHLPSVPSVREPDPERPVQRRQAGSLAATVQDEQLVL